MPGRFLVVEEDAVASITCEAFSYPPSVITWTRVLAALPKGRSSVNNGVLTIRDFSIRDTGTYACTATNKLGSVTAVTALGIQRKPSKQCSLQNFFLSFLYFPLVELKERNMERLLKT